MKKKIVFEKGDIVRMLKGNIQYVAPMIVEVDIDLLKPEFKLKKGYTREKIGITTAKLDKDYVLRSTFNEFKEVWENRNTMQEEKIVELIGEPKALQEKREIWDFIKSLDLGLMPGEWDKLKTLCEVKK